MFIKRPKLLENVPAKNMKKTRSFAKKDGWLEPLPSFEHHESSSSADITQELETHDCAKHGKTKVAGASILHSAFDQPPQSALLQGI